ncbi:MAG: tyrosine/phenylalanine carboxypeptidase domain-containing protein [Candidatus Nanosalina sp.]
MSHKTLQELDGLVREHRGEIEIYSRISPENGREEKRKFEEELRGEIPVNVEDEVVAELSRGTISRNISLDEDIPVENLESDSMDGPDFSYVNRKEFPDREDEFNRLEAELEREDVPESIKTAYRDSIQEARALSRIAANLGGSETVQDASSDIYGTPSESTVEWAEGVLETVDPTDDARYTEGRFTTGEMKDTLEKTLELVGMDRWRVDTRQKGSVKVNAANQEISVPEERKFTENEMMRLLVHEIGSHTLRGANGYSQDFQIFGAGAGGYHQAGEGVALFLEEATGLSNPNTMRKYAGRVKSVESVMNGEEFTETYLMNRELGFDHDQAWSMSLRAHRGGGFIKDHIYAEGLRQVDAYIREEEALENTSGIEEYAGMDGNLEDLLAGKISVEQGYTLRDELEAEYSPLEIVENIDELVPEGVDTSVIDVDPRLEEWYSGKSSL